MGIGKLALRLLKGLVPSAKTVKTLGYTAGAGLAGEGIYRYLNNETNESLIAKLAKSFAELMYPEAKPKDTKKEDLLKKASMILGDKYVNDLKAKGIDPNTIYMTAQQVLNAQNKNKNNPYGLPDYARNIDRYEIDDKGVFHNLQNEYDTQDAELWEKGIRANMVREWADELKNKNPNSAVVDLPDIYSALRK